MSLYEDYRPQTLNEVAGQNTVINTLESVISNNGYFGQIFYLCGASGTGKTTIANCLANKYSGRDATLETLGRDVKVEDIRKWQDLYLPIRPLHGTGWTIIINEAQDLSVDVQKYLLGFTEEVCKKNYISMIFTSMIEPEHLSGNRSIYQNALMSRTSTGEPLRLNDISSPIFKDEIVNYLNGIAAMEGIQGIDTEEIVIKCNGNVRACLGMLSCKQKTGRTVKSKSLKDENNQLRRIVKSLQNRIGLLKDEVKTISENNDLLLNYIENLTFVD